MKKWAVGAYQNDAQQVQCSQPPCCRMLHLLLHPPMTDHPHYHCNDCLESHECETYEEKDKRRRRHMTIALHGPLLPSEEHYCAARVDAYAMHEKHPLNCAARADAYTMHEKHPLLDLPQAPPRSNQSKWRKRKSSNHIKPGSG